MCTCCNVCEVRGHFQELVFFSTSWVLGVKLRWSGIGGKHFTHGVTSLVLPCYFETESDVEPGVYLFS